MLRCGSLLLGLSALLEVALLLLLIVLLLFALLLLIALLLFVALLLLIALLELLLLVVLFLLLVALLLELLLVLLLFVLLLLEVMLLLRLGATHRIGSSRAIDLRPVARSSEPGTCGGRMLKGSMRRISVVLIEELLTVLCSLLVKLSLLRYGRRVPLAHGSSFRQGGPEVDAPSSTVVAHAVVVVHDHRVVVDVVDVDFIDAVDGAVIEEAIAVPVTALIAMAAIAEAIVDAAIEADVRAPVSAMEEISTAEEAPVRRRPECADVGCGNPNAGTQ
jgi:hypothetical protein